MILPQARLPQSKFGVRSKEEIKQLYKAIGAPEHAIWAIGVHGVAANFGVKEWEDVGAKIWAPGSLNAAVTKLVLGLLQILHDKGTIEGYNPPGGPTPQFYSQLRYSTSGKIWKKNMCVKITLNNNFSRST